MKDLGLLAEPQADGALPQNIFYCARALRDASVPVGPAANLGALAAVDASDLKTAKFRCGLHAAFVKKHEHSLLFDEDAAGDGSEGVVAGGELSGFALRADWASARAFPRCPRPSAHRARIIPATTENKNSRSSTGLLAMPNSAVREALFRLLQACESLLSRLYMAMISGAARPQETSLC